jgi:gas vesicle protein
MSTKGNITLCLTSLAAGAAIGLLLAPASGRETRRNLARRGEEMKDKLNDLYEEGTQFVSKSRDQFRDVANNARNAGEDVADRIKNTAGSVSGGSTSGSSGRSTTNSGGASRS